MDHEPHTPTPEEIARLEAEAVRALREGALAQDEGGEAREAPPAEPDWSNVPYVDDVPETEPEPAEEEADYEPTEAERRIAAIPQKKWDLYTALGGAAAGIVAMLILMLGSADLGIWAVVLPLVLAMLAPRYLERWWRRPMPRARAAMLVAMGVTLVVASLVIGLRTGFHFFETPPAGR